MGEAGGERGRGGDLIVTKGGVRRNYRVADT
jgi:hypothetical protein